MGLLDSLRGGGDGPDDETPDGYRVMKNTPKGGWKPVEGFDDMDEPIAKDTFEYNASPLEPGNYRLFAVKNNLNQQPPDGAGWTLEVEGNTKDREQDGEIGRLERKIDRLAESDNSEQVDDPQEAVERQKANLQLAALQSEDFLKRYGDKIILSMFGDDASGGGGSDSAIEYDDWQENPIGASLYEAMGMVREEPEQVERLGEAIGRGVGSFVGSAADGYADSDQSLAEAKGAATDAADEPDETRDGPDEEPTRNLDAGPSSIDDLGADTQPADTDELAADIADARTTARRAGPGEQDRPEDAPAATADDTADPTDDPDDSTADEPAPNPAPEPDHTDAASPDPDPMTASPDSDTTASEDRSSDNAAAEIAGDL